MAMRSLPAPDPRPRTPTEEDVDREVEEREARNQALAAAAQARAQERANSTVEQRLQVLEAFMDRMTVGHTENADRERVRADLQSRYQREFEEWEGPPPVFRSSASSVVDDVFSTVYQMR